MGGHLIACLIAACGVDMGYVVLVTPVFLLVLLPALSRREVFEFAADEKAV